MRLATIDLDWLSEKEFQCVVLLNDTQSDDLKLILSERISCLKLIRSKCTPIVPPVFLSKTCINEWESNTYCANEGKCELCKIKQ